MDCPNNHGAMTRGTDFWVCLSCGAQFKAQMEPVNEDAFSTVLMAQIDELLPLLPSPLAIPLKEFYEERNSVLRLHRLCDAAEIITRFFTIIALGEWRRKLMGQMLPKPLLLVLQPQIERPTFGKWKTMLATLVDQLPSDYPLLVPELSRCVTDRLFSGLRGGDDALAENCLIELRNSLVHGGAMTRERAQFLLMGDSANVQAETRTFLGWTSWMDRLIADLGFISDCMICHFVDGTFLRLVGTVAKAEQVNAASDVRKRIEASNLNNHVLLLRQGEWLDLWPLCDYGEAKMPTLLGPARSKQSGPLVYFRADSNRLLYAALGIDVTQSERQDVGNEFTALFQLDDRQPAEGPAAADFEDEINHDSDLLVGRKSEIDHVRTLLKKATTGVFWITGPGGIGKSYLTARLAHDLRGDPRKALRIAWRFKASDQERCHRTAFLRHAVKSLVEWLQTRDVSLGRDLNELNDQLQSLLSKVSQLQPENPQSRPPRVLFVLDGMDEICRSDPDFARLPFRLSLENIVWLCAGRPEGHLPETFNPDRCTHVFPASSDSVCGMPPMSDGDIRSLLLDRTGALKYGLLPFDEQHEDVDTPGPPRLVMKNRIIDAIVEKAKGLPLYVHFVIDDLLSGRLRFDELPDKLPPTLSDYYREMLRRVEVSDTQALLTPLMVTIAWAEVPLDETSLHYLMVRRTVAVEGSDGLEAVRFGLRLLQAMVRSVPIPGTGRYGFEPYHETFREHIQQNLSQQGFFAIAEFGKVASDWRDIPASHPIHDYAVRFGPRHLLQGSRWDQLAAVLTDISFVEAKRRLTDVDGLLIDYNQTIQAWPGQEVRLKLEMEHQAELNGYIHDLIAHANQPDQNRLIPLPTIPLPANRNSHDQNGDWSQLERLAAWQQFVSTHSGELRRLDSTVFQIAHDAYGDGPIAEAIQKEMDCGRTPTEPWLEFFDRPKYAPTPVCSLVSELSASSICLAVAADGRRLVTGAADNTLLILDPKTGLCDGELSGHLSIVSAVAITPDGNFALSGSGDCTLRLWNLQTGRCESTLMGHVDMIMSVAISADRRWAASGSYSGELRIWDLEGGTCVHVLNSHKNMISAVAISSDCHHVVSGDSKTICVWERATGEHKRSWRLASRAMTPIALTSDGRSIVSRDESDTLCVWNLVSGKCEQKLTGHENDILSASVTPDGTRVVTGSSDRTVRIWNLLESTCDRVLTGHDNLVIDVAISADGRRAFSLDRGNTLRVWDLTGDDTGIVSRFPRGTHLAQLSLKSDGISTASAVSNERAVIADSRVSISSEKEGMIVVRDLALDGGVRSLEGHKGRVECIDVTPDGRRAVSGGNDGTIRVWNLIQGVCECVWDAQIGAASSRRVSRRKISTIGSNRRFHYDSVPVALGITEDQKFVLSVNRIGIVRRWNLSTMKFEGLFTASDQFQLVQRNYGCLAVTTKEGRRGASFLNVRNSDYIVTSTRLWKGNCWDSGMTILCPGCQNRFAHNTGAAGQRIECPACSQGLWVNSFVCDLSDVFPAKRSTPSWLSGKFRRWWK